MQLSAMAKNATAQMERLAVNELHEFAAYGFGIGLAEDSRTDHEHIRTGFLASENVVEFHATVNLDIQFRLHLAKFADLVEAIGDETLAAEARIHRHDQHHVYDIEHVLDAFQRPRQA